jgi:dihydrodipicolinate synthase/N-acetylneuraminate lyase
MAFARAASLTMLENPRCTADWVSEQTAFRLATLSNQITVKDRTENGNRFSLLAAALRKDTFAPKHLPDMADAISRASDVPHALSCL